MTRDIAVLVPLVLVVLGGAALTAHRDQPPTPAAASEDGWLTDAQGRQYRLEPLPRPQAVKIGDSRVRTIWGIEADLAREDEQTFYLKLYRVAPTSTPKAAPVAVVPAEPLPRVVRRVTLRAFGRGLPSAGQWREGLVLGDVTGDGALDIIAGPARKTLRTPTVFSRRDGTWTPASVGFPARAYDYGGLAFRPAQEGRPAALAVGVHLRGLMVHELAASAAFEDRSSGLPFAQRADDAVFSSRALAFADCNADGRQDLIALGEGPRPGGRGRDMSAAMGLRAFAAQPDGAWRTPEPAMPSVFGASLAVGDVDGDGRPDLAVASGQFADARLVLRGAGDCTWAAEPVTTARTSSYVTAVALADVDGDGRAELVAGATRFEGERAFAHLDVFTRGADGQWTRRALARIEGRQRFEAIAVSDVDGDRHADVAAIGPAGALLLFLGDGRGQFVRQAGSVPHAGGCAGAALVAGDLDGDGRAELVAAHAQECTTTEPTACPSEGSLTAWTAGARPAATRR